MKLIMCNECGDIRALHTEVTTCKCGKCSGHYYSEKATGVEVSGPCLVAGIDNNELQDTMRRYMTGDDHAFCTMYIFLPQIGMGRKEIDPSILTPDDHAATIMIRRAELGFIQGLMDYHVNRETYNKANAEPSKRASASGLGFNPRQA